MIISLRLFALFCLFYQVPSTNYKVVYTLICHPDSTNLQRIEGEKLALLIQASKGSSCASENFFRKDSVSVLVKEGILSEYDIIGNPKNRFKTRFNQFTRKDYPSKTAKVYETIGILPYVFSMPNMLNWKIGSEHDTIVGYACTKATTSYGGREYEAWFAPEIPISDGPYIFGGLPGLIIKLSDTKGHYVFTLEQFGEYGGKIPELPTYRKNQPIEISRVKAVTFREEIRKDPLGYLDRITGSSSEGATVQRHGSSEAVPAKSALVDRSWDNNPLELK